MEPISTIEEVSRILVDGGIFAAYDCDWPPVVNWHIEDDFSRLMRKAGEIVDGNSTEDNRVRMLGKDAQLKQIRESNRFRYEREIVFHSHEACDFQQVIGIALSQGVLQTALKLGAGDIEGDLEVFARSVEKTFDGKTLDILFSYRMRLGVK